MHNLFIYLYNCVKIDKKDIIHIGGIHMSDSIIDVNKAQEIIDGGMKQAQEVLENNQAINELVEKVQAKVNEYPLLTTTFQDANILFRQW